MRHKFGAGLETKTTSPNLAKFRTDKLLHSATKKCRARLEVFLANKKRIFVLFMCFMVNFYVAVNGYIISSSRVLILRGIWAWLELAGLV